MLKSLRQRIDRELEGFTLIELMVVVLIIAILIAIAIPTFLGAQDRARDRGAQSNVRNALTAAKTIATDHDGAYLSAPGTLIVARDLRAAEGAILFVDSRWARLSNRVFVLTTSVLRVLGSNILLTAYSKSGKFWSIYANSSGLVKYCPGTLTIPTAATTCGLPNW
ncbi:MAG: prepilin-type N-terminal cleavage/methylation domain-containing protein [Actinobacteria bacterium]|nr:prepilin-type N-terminal cleavage/methylation domain-containing protein [Actinomycetota bacterium]